MSTGKYNVLVDTMPATETRKEILFKIAGDADFILLAEIGTYSCRYSLLTYTHVYESRDVPLGE